MRGKLVDNMEGKTAREGKEVHVHGLRAKREVFLCKKALGKAQGDRPG